MKIIQVTAHYPPNLGGMQNCVRTISERLAKRGHKVEVFTSDVGCREKKLKSTKNLKIHYLKSFEVAHTPIIPSLFLELLKVHKNSIIHLHIAQAFIPEIVYLVSKIKKNPYIAHIHLDVESSGKLGFLLPLYKILFLKRVLKSAEKIIVLTEDYINIVSEKYHIPKEKIVVIPNGTTFKILNRISSRLHTPIRLLFVGRLSKQKNIPLLIESFKNVIKKKYNVILNIVGDGEEKENIIRVIKTERLENKIILNGRIEGEKLQDIYSSSDIFLLTSERESFGTVLIESMASGLAIIAPKIPAVKNVINDRYNGILVEPTSENFAKAIEELIDNQELREKLIKNNLKEVKKYNWNEIIPKIEKVYQEVANEPNKK